MAMSPVGGAFRERLRRFPSLVNYTTIDWFSEWPSDALQGVAGRWVVRARVRTCVRACVRVCVCACVRACVPGHSSPHTQPSLHCNQSSFLASLDMAPATAPGSAAAPAVAPEAGGAVAAVTSARQAEAAAEATRAAVVNMCMAMHVGVRRLAQDFYRWGS
jgi:hypothetical protein